MGGVATRAIRRKSAAMLDILCNPPHTHRCVRVCFAPRAQPPTTAAAVVPVDAAIVGSVQLATTTSADGTTTQLDGRIGLGFVENRVAKWRLQAGTVLPVSKKITLSTVEDDQDEIVV